MVFSTEDSGVKKILVILTGGTICSGPNENAKNQSQAEKAEKYIISDFKKSASPYKDVDFDTVKLEKDILSENMTVSVWNKLIDIFRDKSIWTKYSGVIVLHGTDTLAYTSSLLSVLLAGAPIPICMVSAQLPLMKSGKVPKKESRTNGYANFRASVELIMNGIAPNVYVVYRNIANDKHRPGSLFVHLGSHLLQCKNYSNNFYSKDQVKIKNTKNAQWEGVKFETDTFYLDKIKELKDSVLLIMPYVGLKYSRINIDGADAVVHGTYHSDTVCVERKFRNEKYGDSSVLYLVDCCKEKGISLFLAPCDAEAYSYDSTGDALEHGAEYISDTTLELAYVKTLIGCSMDLKGKELKEFLGCSINYDFAYKKQ